MGEERELTRGAGGVPRVHKLRRGGWNAAKTEIFLETLAMTSNVRASARAAGITVMNCYRRRMRDSGFRIAWMQALAEGYDHLELEMLERARFGTKKIVVQGGREIDTRVFSDSTGFHLLKAHRAMAQAWRVAEAEGRAPEELLAEVRLQIEAAEAMKAGLMIEGPVSDDGEN